MNESKWDLSRLGTGERVALKRSAGEPVQTAAAWRAFYIACSICDKWREPYLIAALCMECLWRESDTPEILPMEECLFRFKAVYNGDGLDNRIMALLETSWDPTDGFLLGKLMNLVRMLRSQTNMKPNFEALADDLQKWNDQSRRVQRRWLRTIYAARADEVKEDT